jgi:hypothetical protein
MVFLGQSALVLDSREYLLQLIQDIGFDLVLEQFDGLDPYIRKSDGLPTSIAEAMLRGYYRTDTRGTFIGVKTHRIDVGA